MAAKILVVDDEIVTRRNVGRFLVGEGHEIIEAADGFEALELLTKNAFDLLIADFVMPHLDGFRLIDIVHSRWPKTSMLLMTGYLSEEAGKTILAGKAEVITKPVDLAHLLAVVGQMLASKHGH
jgi:CheY-like chemotaxis protein